MSNLARFIAAVAHITDFPLEVSEYGSMPGEMYQVYRYKDVTLTASYDGLITVHRGNDLYYQLRVYGDRAIYHNTLKRSIKLSGNKWVTYSGDTEGMAFTNLYDAMKHCGGTHGWI